MFGNKKEPKKNEPEKLKTKKEKVTVDYKNNQFTTIFQKRRFDDPSFSGLLIKLKLKDAAAYNGYKLTYEANKAIKKKQYGSDD